MFNLTPQEQKVILCILVVILLGIGIQWYRDGRIVRQAPKPLVVPNPAFGPDVSSLPSVDSTAKIMVHIDGAVKKPGVYSLPRNSRIYNAIQAAGDTTGNADVTNLNYAEPVQDGEKIEVPFLPTLTQTSSETMSAIPPPNVSVSDSNMIAPPQPLPQSSRVPRITSPRRININTASLQELDTLPGIGPALAQRIIDYRTQHGGFHSIEQIKDVKGIGVKKFEEMKSLITI